MIVEFKGKEIDFNEVVDVFDEHGPYCKEVEVIGFDDNGVEYTIDDFRCDDERILQDGECVCGAFDCPTEYACHTSGY